jgi:hypothetical protein
VFDEAYILFHFNNILKYNGMSSTKKNESYLKFYVVFNVYFLFYFRCVIFVNFIIFYILRPHLHSIIYNIKTRISSFSLLHILLLRIYPSWHMVHFHLQA